MVPPGSARSLHGRVLLLDGDDGEEAEMKVVVKGGEDMQFEVSTTVHYVH